MKIDDSTLEKVYRELHKTGGGTRNDSYGLLYLEQQFNLPREQAQTQLALGGNDHGIDGFHLDTQRRNLYLLQFRYSDNVALFKDGLERIIKDGFERIFGARSQEPTQNQAMLRLKRSLVENASLIDRVFFHFVFKGDPEIAERSQVLDRLREDLENKKFLLDQYFNRPVSMVIEYRSTHSNKLGSFVEQRRSHDYPLQLQNDIQVAGAAGQQMHVSFVPLIDLHRIHVAMGQRFFERNIRSSLPEDGAVNRALLKALQVIVLDEKEDASTFAFHHNGVTIAAERIASGANGTTITEPRLLNGAQTVTTFSRFMEKHREDARLQLRSAALHEVKVLCRIITAAKPEFVTQVTINNNRQNPVEPWNLRANDMIQLELQDKFREELGIYYERQENAFANLSDDELEEAGYKEGKAIELLRLAHTFLVSDGDIDKLSRLRDVFEAEKLYSDVFRPQRLKADSRHVLLCYKAQFKLRRLQNKLLELGTHKYSFIGRARHLLWALTCQGLLNDPKLDALAEDFGTSLAIETNFTEALMDIASKRCRFLISHVVNDKKYADRVAEENYSFLRTNAAFEMAMAAARKEYSWQHRKLG